MNSTFKRYEMHGPSGVMATMAPNARKAWSNLRFRLVHECGMSWYRAREYDHRDLHEVKGTLSMRSPRGGWPFGAHAEGGRSTTRYALMGA